MVDTDTERVSATTLLLDYYTCFYSYLQLIKIKWTLLRTLGGLRVSLLQMPIVWVEEKNIQARHSQLRAATAIN